MLTIEMNRLAKKAVQKPEMLNPPTTLATSWSSSALITRINKPSVSSVSGRVRKTSSGRRTALAKPSSRAATISAEVPEKRMPLKTRLAPHRERAVIVQLMKNPASLSNLVYRFCNG